jgi:hypothetical protein
MRLNMMDKTVLLILGILMAVSAGRAEVGGKMTGVVKDQTDSVIAGATVVVVNTATGVKQTTKADEQGN